MQSLDGLFFPSKKKIQLALIYIQASSILRKDTKWIVF